MFKRDWVERQIESIAKSLAGMLFGKKSLSNLLDEFDDEESANSGLVTEDGILETVVGNYFSSGKIFEAHDLISSAIKDRKTIKNLVTALTFYDKLLGFDDEKLASLNFPREKIEDAIKNLRALYDVND